MGFEAPSILKESLEDQFKEEMSMSCIVVGLGDSKLCCLILGNVGNACPPCCWTCDGPCVKFPTQPFVHPTGFFVIGLQDLIGLFGQL